MWRTGANENTTITFSSPVKIGGKPLAAGTYGLHMVPTPKQWTVVFSNVSSAWGSFTYDAIDEDGESRPFRPEYGSLAGPVQWTMWLTPGTRYLINPGSVGQPRDSDWRAAFALYEHNGGPLASVTFYRIPYDIQKTQQRILSAQLPDRLAARLQIGR